MTIYRAFVLALLALLAGSFVRAAEWPHFRGPYFNGSTDEKGLPERWNMEEGIAWTAKLPGPSAATPVIWGDHVFVSSSDPDGGAKGALKALALDRKSGKKLWEHEVAEGIARDHRSNYASSSPATDGKVVVFFYGNGELIAFDFSGTKVWERNIQEDYGEFAFLWTFSSSPLLYGGKLYLQVLQRDTAVDGRGFADRENESYLLAMDPATGKTLWRQVRPSVARAESREAFTSPVPLLGNEAKLLLVVGGDALTAHDLGTGKELWRWGTWNPTRKGDWRLVPSPVAGKDVVLVCAPKRDPIYAIRTGGSGKLSDDAVVWVSREERALTADVPTPAYYDGDFFVLNDLRGYLSRIDPSTGKPKWSIETPGRPKYEASPLAADGKVYLINFAGEVAVIDAGDGKVLQVVAMDTTDEYPIRSSIAAAHGQLFIRTNRALYCVGAK